jgi:hypothetical protein
MAFFMRRNQHCKKYNNNNNNNCKKCFEIYIAIIFSAFINSFNNITYIISVSSKQMYLFGLLICPFGPDDLPKSYPNGSGKLL